MVSGLPSCLGSGLGLWVPRLNLLLLPVGAPGTEEAESTQRRRQCPGVAGAQHHTWMPSRKRSLSSPGSGGQKTPRCHRAELPLEAPSRLFSPRQPHASLGLWPHPSDLCLCLCLPSRHCSLEFPLPSQVRTPVLGLRSHLIQDGLVAPGVN